MLALCGGVLLLASLAPANRTAVRRAEETCPTQPFEPCLDTKCCSNEPGFQCLKRVGRTFAQCRKTAGHCEPDGVWECPGWEDCTTESYGNCYDSMCCAEQNQACHRRRGRKFAQCRVIPRDGCVDDPNSDWECPGWTKPPAPPPPRNSAPAVDDATLIATGQCSGPFQPCTDTHCCTGGAFKCLEKRNRFFAQCMRPETCVKSDTMTCNNVEGLPVIPRAPQHQPDPAGLQDSNWAPAAATPAAAAQPEAFTVGGGTMVMLFLLAVCVGAALMVWYRFYYMPKPPTRPPMAEDAGEMTPAPPSKPAKKSAASKKGSKEEKASIVEEQDEGGSGSEDEERGNGNGKGGKGGNGAKKAPPKKAPPKKAASMDDDDEMDL